MTIGRHKCNKPKNDPTYNKEWSGVSYAKHSRYICPDCGETLHDEDENYYCPRCDDYKNVYKRG